MLIVAGCASQPATPRLSLDDINAIPVNCHEARLAERTNNIRRLEDVLQNTKFYTVDGVAGSTDPNRLDKRYYVTASRKLWTLKLNCPDSRSKTIPVESSEPMILEKPNDRVVCQIRRVRQRQTQDQDGSVSGTTTAQETEICTNQPLGKTIQIGSRISETDVAAFPPLGYRQYQGSIYRWFIVRDEIHQKKGYGFIGIMMFDRQNRYWTVVDKF